MVMDPRGGPAVPSEPWQRPPPAPRLTDRLFPRYVQEVIQRGRSCVRPACTPVLSVVPAVSDLELSETEYVRPARVPLARLPAVEPLLPGQDSGRRTGRDGAGLQLLVSIRGEAGHPRGTCGWRAREEVLLFLALAGAPHPPPLS